jgi:Ca-activated chloride channel homolog
MLSWQWPWLALLLPLPAVIWWLLPPVAGQQGGALRVARLAPFAPLLANATTTPGRSGWLRPLLAIAAWSLLVVAACRPLWLGEPLALPVVGRDLMLAIDLSGSMEVEDFMLGDRRVNRLVATQAVAGEFIRRREGDRLGLILFGRNAYLQTPLTFDRATLRQHLDEAVIGLAGKETAIGDAIGLGVKRMLAVEGDASQVLILLTDGANTAGEVDPLTAARLAADRGLRIYTIGIGADEMLVQSLFGSRRINPSADLDEKSLTAIAELTGGRYFRARDTAGLEEIYRLIDALEPMPQEAASLRPQRQLYPWPLAMALLLAAILILLPRR